MLQFSSSLSLQTLAGKYLDLTLGHDALDPGGPVCRWEQKHESFGARTEVFLGDRALFLRRAVTHAAAEPRK